MAEERSHLFEELAGMARAEEQRLANLEAEQQAELAKAEEDPSYGLLPQVRVKQLEKEFETAFLRPLPVSARGDTGFHRALGFNHTGRIDVAVAPDSPEGRWLRNWLERGHVPYLAFKSFVPGQASAPHIHIGPPSLRLRAAD